MEKLIHGYPALKALNEVLISHPNNTIQHYYFTSKKHKCLSLGFCCCEKTS